MTIDPNMLHLLTDMGAGVFCTNVCWFIIFFFAGKTRAQNCMYTHRRGTKAYEKTSVAHAWAHVKNMWFKLRYWLMFFPWFFSSVFCSSPVASLNGKRSYPTPAGLWLPFSWLLIPLRVQSSEAQIAAGYTWKDRRVDLNIFSVFFSDVRFIFVMYLLKYI